MKLIMYFGVIALLVGVVGYMGHFNSAKIESVREYHEFMSIPALSILEKISTEFERMHGSILMASLDLPAAHEEYKKARKNLFDLLKEYEKLTSVKGKSGDYLAWEEMKDMMTMFSSKMKDSADNFDSIATDIFKLYEEEKSEDEITNMLNALQSEKKKFKQILEKDKDMELVGADRENKRIDEVVHDGKIVSFIITILAILLTIGLGLYVSQRITKPLEQLSKTVDEVSKGNFKVNIEKTSSIKEINQLAESLERVMTTMKFAVEENKPKKK